MSSNLIKLFHIIKKSKLPVNVQEELIALFSKAKDEQLAPVLKFCENHPELLPGFYGLMQAKRQALKNRNQNALEEIIQEEYRALHTWR